MRKQRWKKWVTLAVAAGMLVSQLGMLSVKAEEEQSAEEVMESVEETLSENEVAELEAVEESALEDEEETSEYEDEPVEGKSNEIPDETEESGAVEEGNGETEPAQEDESGEEEITEVVTTVEKPETLLEEAGQECPEFSYVQDFSQQGVRVSIQAREGVVRVGTSVQITLMEESDVDALEGIVQDKINEIAEIRQQESEDGGRSIFEMYSNLEAHMKKNYGFQIAMTYVDGEGNAHIIRPEENEAIQVSIEMLNSEELSTDDMHSVEVFSLTDEMPTPFAEGENVMPSVYSFVVVQYNARADAQMVAAQQKAWEIINTYTDPEYFLDDLYKQGMTEAQYEELRQAALAATAGCATQYDKIEAITGFVADRIYYDYPYYWGDTSSVYLNPYDVYTQKRTICSGYARLMRTMLISIGIPCMNIHGDNHEYNAVYDSQQGKWIFTDATWCSRNAYFIDSNGIEKWNKNSCDYARFDLRPEEIAQLSNHEVYQVDGLINSPQDQIYYSLVAPGDNWQNMDWHIGICGTKDLNASKLLFVDEFAGIPVTEVVDFAFRRCSNLSAKLILPSGIEKIGDFAFWDCSGLSGDLVLPEGLTQIGEHAFQGCSGLTGDLKLPSRSTEIGPYAFNGCSGLNGNLVLPEGLTQIGDFAFWDCSGLSGDLVLPEGLTQIGEHAFQGCSGLTGDLKLPSRSTEIGPYAFNGCSGLNGNLVLPEGLTQIGDLTFRGCSGLSGDLKLPKGLIEIGKQAFDGCSGLSGDLVLPEGLTQIGDLAFQGCSGLTGNLVLSSKLTEIGYGTFRGCSGLTGDLKLPSRLTEIGPYAFDDCSGLTGNLILPSGVTKIGEDAFYCCWSLTGLVLPSSLTEIGENAFAWCTHITSIDLSSIDTSNLQNIEDAFFSCDLETIKSPKKMGTSIIRLQGTFVDPNGRETSVLSQEFCNTVLTRKEESNPTPTPVPTPTSTPKPTPTPTTDEQTRAQVSSFVSRMYTVALNRNAEAEGLNDWTNRLLAHEKDGAGIAHGFIMSDEFKNRNLGDREFVNVLYRTFFNREADEEGCSTWLSELAKGRDRGYVLSGFVNSVEFDNLCDSYGIIRGTMREDGSPCNPGIRQFVERQYTKVLNRTGEKEGIDDWTDAIISGRYTPEDVAKKFFQSEEFMNRNLNNSDYIETLYETFLGRPSDPEGKAYWLQQISAGMNRDTVLEGFSKSTEFAGILAGYGL